MSLRRPVVRRSSSSYLPVLLFGCAILVISTDARSSFGPFLPEMAQARGWLRETFSLAFAPPTSFSRRLV